MDRCLDSCLTLVLRFGCHANGCVVRSRFYKPSDIRTRVRPTRIESRDRQPFRLECTRPEVKRFLLNPRITLSPQHHHATESPIYRIGKRPTYPHPFFRHLLAAFATNFLIMAAAVPRLSASVVLLRRSAANPQHYQVLLAQRAKSLNAFSSFFVFPGRVTCRL